MFENHPPENSFTAKPGFSNGPKSERWLSVIVIVIIIKLVIAMVIVIVKLYLPVISVNIILD